MSELKVDLLNYLAYTEKANTLKDIIEDSLSDALYDYLVYVDHKPSALHISLNTSTASVHINYRVAYCLANTALVTLEVAICDDICEDCCYDDVTIPVEWFYLTKEGRRQKIADKEQERARKAAQDKKSAEEQEYQLYLKLKEKYENG